MLFCNQTFSRLCMILYIFITFSNITRNAKRFIDSILNLCVLLRNIGIFLRGKFYTSSTVKYFEKLRSNENAYFAILVKNDRTVNANRTHTYIISASAAGQLSFRD